MEKLTEANNNNNNNNSNSMNVQKKQRLNTLTGTTYDHKAVETEWYEYWVNKGYFRPDMNSNKKKFIMVLPPPNVTGKLHLGHALTTAIQDALIRYHRMKGEETLWVPGTDHAGIATQVVVEKILMKEQNLSRHDLGREKFTQEIWKWKEQYGNAILKQLRSLGASVDWSREQFTMNEQLCTAVKEAFIRMHQRGLIFRATRLVNWCCALNSTISNIEVDYKDISRKTTFNVPGYTKPIAFGIITEFAYKVVGADDPNAEIIVATTRPETILGDTAVAIHPDDTIKGGRYEHLAGKFLQHPFLDKTIPIICDAISVKRDFKTGAVKITPGHDPKDFECGKRHNLDMINILNDDGTMNANCGQFAGMKRFDARIAVIKALKSKNLWRSEENHEMKLGFCSRSSDIIEPLLKPQWYVNTTDAAKQALEKVESKELRIHPEGVFEHTWKQWLEKPESWCISRQLWWGHSIPAYYISIPGHISSQQELPDHWVVANNKEEAALLAKQKFGDDVHYSIEQDADVLDTWFSASLFPFSVFGWPNQQSADFQRYFPTTLLETGHDILFFWVAKMVMSSIILHDTLPFSDVFLHAVVRDPTGEKMSKSKGNVIDPLDIIHGATLQKLNSTLEESNLSQKDLKQALALQTQLFPNGIPDCGTDALRFGLCSQTAQLRDMNLNIQQIVKYRLFCNKIWQATKYLLSHSNNDKTSHHLNYMDFNTFQSPSHSPISAWILSRLAHCVKLTTLGLEHLKLYQSTEAIHDFILKDFCDTYLETARRYLNQEQGEQGSEEQRKQEEEIQETLYICIHTAFRLLHPFMPFLTEELFQYLPRHTDEPESICITMFPTIEGTQHWANPSLENEVAIALKLSTSIRNLKDQFNAPNKDPDHKKKNNKKDRKNKKDQKNKEKKIPAAIYLEAENEQSKKIAEKYLALIGDMSKTSDQVFLDQSFSKQNCATTQLLIEEEESRIHYEIYLQLDKEAEKRRIEKKINDLEKQRFDLENKISKLMMASSTASDGGGIISKKEEARKRNTEKLDLLKAQIEELRLSAAKW